MPIRVLVVDDEEPLRELLRGYLVREGWQVEVAADGPTALDAVHAFMPDLIVLDLNLPELDGIEVCRQLRTFSDAYVLMLTARAEEVDTLIGLAVGADDYMAKPFSPRELVARLKVLLRRPRREPASSAGPEGLRVDVARHEVSIDGRVVELTATEFGLLAALARDPGVVVGRQALLDAVWAADFEADDHLVDVHIGNLRRKLGDAPEAPRFIETIRGFGYRLKAS